MSQPDEAWLVVETGATPLPVLIRDRHLRTVHSGLGNTTVSVEPGPYVVGVTLPGNHVVEETITVVTGRTHRVDLGPAAEQPVGLSRIVPVPPEPLSLASDRSNSRRSELWRREMLMRVEPPATFQSDRPPFIGQLRTFGHLQHVDVSTYKPFTGFLRIEGDSGTVTVALPSRNRSLLVQDLRAGQLAVAAYPTGRLAQLAMEYVLFEDTERGSLLFPAGRIVEHVERGRPITAALGGYLCLRLGEPDRLRGWSKTLANRFAWLPDGAIIAGEVAAVAGDHRAAADQLIIATERGIPLFTAGLSILVSRLRQYTRDGATRRSLAGDQRSEVDRLEEVYADLIPYADFAAPTTTFRGRP